METIEKLELQKKSKEELIEEILILKKHIKNKKYGLVWDKERERERVVLDCENNFPVLKHIKSKDLIKNPYGATTF